MGLRSVCRASRPPLLPDSPFLIRPLRPPGEQGTALVGFGLFPPSGRARKCRGPAGCHCLPVTERTVGLALAFPSEAERLRIQARGSLFQKSLPGGPVASPSRRCVSPAPPNPSLLGSPQLPALQDRAHPLSERVGLGWRVLSGPPLHSAPTAGDATCVASAVFEQRPLPSTEMFSGVQEQDFRMLCLVRAFTWGQARLGVS